MSPTPIITRHLRGLAATARDLPPATVIFVSLTVLALLLAVVIALTPPPTPPSSRTPPVPAAPVQLENEPEIRVRVLRRASEALLESTHELNFVLDDGSTLSLESPVTVTIDGGQFLIHSPSTSQDPIVLHAPIRVASAEYRVDSLVVQGEITILPANDDPDRFDLVVSMPIERYLPGVLAAELFSHWKPEAFRAQAVAARSYALHDRELAVLRGRDWDVERTTRSQSYLGTTSLGVALDAVRDTRGQVLSWDGGLLRAYYSSSVGGRGASARDVFLTAPGFEFNLAEPLQTTPREYFDQGSPSHRWTRTRDAPNLSARIRAWGEQRQHPARHLEQLTSVTVSAHNDVDRPTTYLLTDLHGQDATLTAEQLRVACNFTTDRFDPLEFGDRVLSGDLEMQFAGDRVTIRGRGFGHGVGMCQYSAAELAERGERYPDILERYYPGASLVRWYE